MANTVFIKHYHYLQLTRLADLRRINITEAVEFLFDSVDDQSDNWLSSRYLTTPNNTLYEIELPAKYSTISTEGLLRKIQALPRNIRSLTDGPYVGPGDYSFFEDEHGVQGINVLNHRFLDPSAVNARDKGVFPLVRDLLPEMSLKQFRLYNTVNSQFVRLIRQPHLSSMPQLCQNYVDAGAYVGYKAIAMSVCAGRVSKGLAIELDTFNYEYLNKNLKLNSLSDIIDTKNIALADSEGTMSAYVREHGTMAFSLIPFDSMKEHDNSIASGGAGEKIQMPARRLDAVLKEWGWADGCALHISVNGAERIVLDGLDDHSAMAGKIRVTVPYKINEVPVEEMVIDFFENRSTPYLGKFGGSLVYGVESRLKVDDEVFKYNRGGVASRKIEA